MARSGGEYDAEAERDLVRAIADATLLVPMREDPDTGRPGLWATTDAEGQTQFLAFTDAGALEAWVGGPAPYALISGVELAVIAAEADAAALWINASGPHGGRLDRRMVAVVAAGRAMDLEVDEGDVLKLRTTGVGALHVRTPDPPEPEALEALRAAVAAAPVSGAWLLEATVPPPRTSSSPSRSSRGRAGISKAFARPLGGSFRRTGSSMSCRSPATMRSSRAAARSACRWRRDALRRAGRLACRDPWPRSCTGSSSTWTSSPGRSTCC
jgi:hypothetical protein